MRPPVVRALVLVMLVAGALAALPPGSSNQAGAFDIDERGCYCHGPVAAPTVGFTIEGLPGMYTPGATYHLWINVTFTDVPATENRSQGGFFIRATAGTFGRLDGPEGDLVHDNGSTATQTANGSMVRRWQLLWTAPDAGGLVITFVVDVNTVNGNKSETLSSDHWTYKTVRIGLGDAPVIEGPPPPVQHMALETYGALALGVVAGLVAVYLFLTSAKKVEAPPTGPDKGRPPPG